MRRSRCCRTALLCLWTLKAQAAPLCVYMDGVLVAISVAFYFSIRQREPFDLLVELIRIMTMDPTVVILLIIAVVVLVGLVVWVMNPPQPRPTPPAPQPIPPQPQPIPPQPTPVPPTPTPPGQPTPNPGLNERLMAELSWQAEVPTPVFPPNSAVRPQGDFRARLRMFGNNWTVIIDSGTVRGLTGPPTAVHIHMGAPGQKGPVLKTLTFRSMGNGVWSLNPTSWSTVDPTEKLTPAIVQAIRSGNTYLNWHTVMNKDGEARGQIQLVTF